MFSQNRNTPKTESTGLTPLFDFTEDKQTPVLPAVPHEPISITKLTLYLRELIELNFADIEVVGQVSNLTQPRSGHIYLTLKDEESQLPAVIWKSTVSKFRFKIKEGMEVICRGRLDVYPPQGKYQMIINGLEPKGIGALELAFRQLHDKLAALGIFDPNRKKTLPKVIQNVALITSLSGAAVRDFLQVLGRRTKRVNVLIIPVQVQGNSAAQEIANAIQTVHRLALQRPIDCIVVTRGGGSREDLWAFNEEVLVRSVAASKIPVVSGVGHEIDVTLCDLAADIRALTPSEAAERIAPEDTELSQNLLQIQRQLDDLLEKRIQFYRNKLSFLEKQSALVLPERMIENRRRIVDLFEERLERSVDHRVQMAVQKFSKTAASLEALSPLAILARGYSLTETETGHRIQKINEIRNGDTIRTRLSNGVLKSIVTDIVAEIQ
ncbi:MAG: exodeoxyribonuclease VII large subunit [Planctomycetaceae bacterium]|jgi:exodeoxyribonuclease VII large subunit|nr:exodeoxyribonuclease VII large subunit [Planctomycetaceae bacterium]